MKQRMYMLIILLSLSNNIIAQKKEADEKFRLYEYAKAIPLYEEYVSNNSTDYEAYLNLAAAYRLTNEIHKAIETSKKVIAFSESKPDDLYVLVNLLLVNQNLNEARTFANQYKAKQPGDRATTLLKSLDNYELLQNEKNAYSTTNKTEKYTYSVLSAKVINNQIIVTAEESKGNDTWTGRGSPDLFTTDASFTKLTEYAKTVTTHKTDGFPSFTNNGNVMYYSNRNDDGVKENGTTTYNLQIAVAKMENGKWKKESPFPYNDKRYNYTHPTLSEDGTILLFSSNMPGGKGGMDLYMCKSENGIWSSPQNVSSLNTYGNEVFPVFNGNTIYFSSDGMVGLGGLDIYKSSMKSHGFLQPENIKAPLNSSYDDYYLTTDDNMNSGYLTSSRFGITTDDIVYFEKTKKEIKETPTVNTRSTVINLKVKVVDKFTDIPLPYVSVSVKDGKGEVISKSISDENGMIEVEDLPNGNYAIQGILNEVTTTLAKVIPEDFNTNKVYIQKQVTHNDPRFTLKGLVVNVNTGKPVEGVKVKCSNQTLGKDREVITQSNGEFFFQLEQKSDFKVSGQKAKWLSSETAEETTKGLDRSKELYVKLTLNMQEPTANAVIKLKKIFYAYDKCDIRPVSALELDRLIKLMNDYPDMVIELGSHTDARGSDEYNLSLSQCRADAAVAYLVSKGIVTNRISAKGYGETKLINTCGNDVTCTDKEHEENRRTEFKIISCSNCPVAIE